ncbi:bglB [Symbiodinium pilosum]|uniref:beta-glucosidase n=1 Tax=Symbiodinium pilosum TaxID=2952 RepID=A0A812UAD2_SYMPI|nr:bglB [Symbiodinium pilosum]
MAVSAAKQTVVLIQAPGAVVMPWKKSADAILMMFLGGEETGTAWARILFGDEAPAGRLPIMMPLTEADSIKPGTDLNVDYDEGLRTSYRNPSFKDAFPFGHGLTYTTFEYSQPVLGNCTLEASAPVDAYVCLRLAVRNVGRRAGRTVVQCYLEMPAEAGYATPILRGFRKTGIIPANDSESVLLHFNARELSFYDPAFQQWIVPSHVRALVGESSRDIRLSMMIKIPQGSSPGPARRWSAFWWLIAVLVAIAVIVPFISYTVIRRKRDDASSEDSSAELSSEFSG